MAHDNRVSAKLYESTPIAATLSIYFIVSCGVHRAPDDGLGTLRAVRCHQVASWFRFCRPMYSADCKSPREIPRPTPWRKLDIRGARTASLLSFKSKQSCVTNRLRFQKQQKYNPRSWCSNVSLEQMTGSTRQEWS